MKTKKAFDQKFEVLDGQFNPQNNNWNELITKTKNNGWRNPSDVFRCGGRTINGTLVGFHIPSNSKENHPKIAFINTGGKKVAIKF
ncbi:MAG: hypothetical protein WCG25_02125 [bacterium]